MVAGDGRYQARSVRAGRPPLALPRAVPLSRRDPRASLRPFIRPAVRRSRPGWSAAPAEGRRSARRSAGMWGGGGGGRLCAAPLRDPRYRPQEPLRSPLLGAGSRSPSVIYPCPPPSRLSPFSGAALFGCPRRSLCPLLLWPRCGAGRPGGRQRRCCGALRCAALAVRPRHGAAGSIFSRLFVIRV